MSTNARKQAERIENYEAKVKNARYSNYCRCTHKSNGSWSIFRTDRTENLIINSQYI